MITTFMCLGLFGDTQPTAGDDRLLLLHGMRTLIAEELFKPMLLTVLVPVREGCFEARESSEASSGA